MPQWELVGESADGEPIVVTEWIGELRTAPIRDVNGFDVSPARFCDRWAAKRVIRRRNLWREFRCVKVKGS